MTTLTAQALARLREQRSAQQEKEALAGAQDSRFRQEHAAILRIFKRDILQGAKLPTGTRIESIIHGHHIAVYYGGGRSIAAEHLFRLVGDSLAVTVFDGLDQRWTADKGNIGGVRKKSFDDFLDAFIWLFRSELERMMT